MLAAPPTRDPPMTDTAPTVQLLLTGNELMSGDTVDSNSAMIAQRFGEQGLGISRKVTLGDDPQELSSELAQMASHADVVIVNGGLGPTIDDLTAEVLAAVAGVELVEHPEARAHIESWCARRGLVVNDANLKQSNYEPFGKKQVSEPSARHSKILDEVEVGLVAGLA